MTWLTMCTNAPVLTVLYVGDYDPSGMHTSALHPPERLARYCGEDAHRIHLSRIAIHERDTDPPNRLLDSWATDKVNDPRCRRFVDNYGSHCWELDALSPVVLRERVEVYIVDLIDAPARQVRHQSGVQQRASLAAYVEGFKSSCWPAHEYPDASDP